jgi:hypothetical protein
MRILLDTNILLNDFFHRNPEFGFQRISDPAQKAGAEAYREKVHLCLENLSLSQQYEILSTTAIFTRFAALLGDLLVPAELVLEELSYWKSNLKLLEVAETDLEHCLLEMQGAESKMDYDDYLLRRLANKNEVEVLLSSIPKSREFFWPVLFFKPENIEQLINSESRKDA